MKRFIYGGLSTLVLATSILPSVFAAPAPQFPPVALNSMAFNFTAPFISNSGLLNDSHIIQVMVVGMSVEDLMVSIPPQMEKFSQIQVTDETGKEVAAKITSNKEQVAIVFDKPVESGRLLQINIIGTQTDLEEGRILLYRVTAKRTGLQGDIPVGTARIQVPGRG
ncbi:hypothetical protein [Leptolyngbya sp. FACHB-17]|uniref:hypothetical protein n=1 Tax=unclassified Leptolyngbya TaxID=2650499 RepID=UPI001680779E|nr:hypothetical protein [Leptolyngbya sp. FACHB-17]MBD2080179.1 hypothetical protein [Leptolyngbya sp. FACHB-17]